MSTKNKISYENEENILDSLENSYMNPTNKISKHKKEIRLIAIDYIKAKNQEKIDIQGIPIYFPYKPYENQVVYMSKVIESLNNGCIAALESPTGTGKTLCLLCASLAWLAKKRKELNDNNNFEEEKTPKIYFTSRTHSQLSNVINELKKTVYLPRNCILSSREKMCVNNVVKVFKGNLLNLKCKEARMKGFCKYFKGVEKLSYGAYDSCDIEELFKLGSKSNFCPFHFERNKKDTSDIIFLPYNYIFDPDVRKRLKLNFDNSILIIDEAHNIQEICENGISCCINSKELDEIIENLKELHLFILTNGHKILKDSEMNSIEIKDVQNLEKCLMNIKNYLKSLDVKQGKFWPEFGLKLSVKELFDIFFEGSKGKNKVQKTLVENEENDFEGINVNNIKNKIDLLNKIDIIFNEELQKGTIISNLVSVLNLIKNLSENYLEFQKSEDKNPINNISNNYKFFIEDVEEKNNYLLNKNKKNIANFTNKKIRTLNLFCFNPGLGFSQVIKQNILSTIITSGTLSPIESLESELKVEFKIKLENSHVIDMQQIKFSVISNSPNNQNLIYKFDAKNKNNLNMIKDLGITILNLIKKVPGGILIFFTSYSFMQNCVNIWTNSELISKFNEFKEIFQDLHNPSQNKLIIENYKKSCQKNHKGGIFFSVCRGSSSEGINFNDDLARMVIVVGIPYANLMDVKVQLKKEFLDEYNRNLFNYIKNSKIKRLTSNDWYTQSATKTVNQALGRVIRHIDDYGSMVLIDFRYREIVNKGLISRWIKGACKFYVNSEIYKDNEKFFENMKSFIKNKKMKERKEIEDSFEMKKKKKKRCSEKENRRFNKDEENFNIINDISIDNVIKKENKNNNEVDINQFLNDNPDFLDIFQSSNKKDNKKYNKENNNINNNTNNNNNISKKNIKNKENISTNISQTSNDILPSPNLINLSKTPIKSKSLNNNNNSEKKDILQCPICFDLMHNSKYSFLVSKCGHICCENCWEKTLSNKLECPLCKKKVMKRNLIKIFI